MCAAACLAACGESTVLSPTAPTSPSSEKVQELAIACAADLLAVSPSGTALPVSFAAPVVQGGLAPVTSTCSPASGSTFSVGRTTVTCDARDGLQQAASCSLSVSVQESLGIPRIVAFGDSITFGIQADLISGSDRIDFALSYKPAEAYPFRLESKFGQLFGPGETDVINEGREGEGARDARFRLVQVLARWRPDVLLFMEGSDDLFSQTTGRDYRPGGGFATVPSSATRPTPTRTAADRTAFGSQCVQGVACTWDQSKLRWPRHRRPQ